MKTFNKIKKFSGYLDYNIEECAWFAARLDPALNMAFSKLTRRMEPNKAIVRIARKLLNRIFYVLKYKRRYKNETVE